MRPAIVADVVGVEKGALPTLEQQVEFDGGTDLNSPNSSTYNNSGTYEIIWEREQGEEQISSQSPRMGW